MMQAQDRSVIAPSGTLIVEMIGPPGAGKTIGMSHVHETLRQAGWATFDPVEGARTVAARTLLGRLGNRLPARLGDFFLWRVYLLYRAMGAARAVVRHPASFRWLVSRQRRRPAEALARRRRVVHWYLRMVGTQEFYRRHARAGEAVVFDEGRLHRVVQLFSSPVDRGSESDVRRHLDMLSPPDLVIHLSAPVDTCLSRIRSRGVWDRLSEISETDLDRFLTNAQLVVDQTVTAARQRGWNVVEVDNSGDHPSDLAPRVAASVFQGLGGMAAQPTRRLAPRLVVPGPRHAITLLRGRLDGPALHPDLVDDVLRQLGTSRRGRITHLALARRSDSVRVDTGLGRLVLRAYPRHWPEGSVHHEHVLLRHLEEAGYPATRLVATAGDETVLHRGDRTVAAYRFVPGRNLSGSLLGKGRTADALHVAGQLLCTLHLETEGLDLGVAHHLTMEGNGEQRIASQLALVDDLASRPDQPADLVEQAPAIRDRLRRLHARLAEAEPVVAVIHGDFGLHNLLVGREGATVIDFELARRDWRMVDVVESLAAMSPSNRRAFLAGYSLRHGGEPKEWRWLAEMWEYHRLAGAVRAWDSYLRRGDPGRLDVVRRRLGAADRVAERGLEA